MSNVVWTGYTKDCSVDLDLVSVVIPDSYKPEGTPLEVFRILFVLNDEKGSTYSWQFKDEEDRDDYFNKINHKRKATKL